MLDADHIVVSAELQHADDILPHFKIMAVAHRAEYPRSVQNV